MKKLSLTLMLTFMSLFISSQDGNLGVNTVEPMQKLHLSGANATILVESLNATNNSSNDGLKPAPLYVDSQGNLTLDFDLYYRTIQFDEIDGDDPFTNVLQPVGTPFVDQELFSYEVTVNRTSYLEIKFSLSFQVCLNPDGVTITDELARVIQTYVLLNHNPARKYGMTSKAYINAHLEGVNTTYYNNAATYILLSPGTHTISFYGGVGSGSNNRSTYVNFGLDQDMVLMRIY
jgi:hypothetical protein